MKDFLTFAAVTTISIVAVIKISEWAMKDREKQGRVK